MTREKRNALFQEVVRKKQSSMYRAAYVLMKRPEDAEDAVWEAVSNVYKSLGTLRDEQALPAYLMRAVINTCKSQLRKKGREFPVEDFAPYEKGAEGDTPVWFYLTGLPEKYSLPLVMKFSENMTTNEIAAALGLPEGTVSTRISRGLKILKKQMEGGEEA